MEVDQRALRHTVWVALLAAYFVLVPPGRALDEAEARFRAAGQPKFEAGPDRITRLIDESRFES
ncbi:MAG: hypothetical protein ACRDHG_02490 [Anaerolineales bacterium]